MDLGDPLSSVIPSGHGAVLGVLARTDAPLSGRGVAALTDGKLSQSRASDVLRELTYAGIVECEAHPPAKLYTLNRNHVAYDAIVSLAGMRDRVFTLMRQAIAQWSSRPQAVWLFGSFARGDGGPVSDIDVFVVRRGNVSSDHPRWNAQLYAFGESVQGWTGNRCALVEYSSSDLKRMVRKRERLIEELRCDGIVLGGATIAHELGNGSTS